MGFGDVKGRPCGRRVGCSAKAVRVGPWALDFGFGDLKLPSGSSCDRPQGYVASPARCVRSMRFRVGPEHNNVFVIYAVDVTLAQPAIEL